MILIRCLAVAAFGAAILPTINAQEKSLEAQVDFKRVEVGSQNTPQFTAQNVKDKRWNPKIWLEIDAGFSVKKGKVKGEVNPSPIVDNLDFKYYVLLNKRDAQGKFIMLTASITYLNASEDDRESHAMAFVSPSSLARVLSNPRFTAPEITPTAVAIVATKGAAVCGFYSQGGPAGAWWEKTENFSIVDGVLLPKSKTPFAPLWGDYDLETAAK
jgi:hypothetical protein